MANITLEVASLVLTGIFIKPIFILWAISLCMGRRKGDPARTGFSWMKAISPFVCVSLTLFVVAEVMVIFILEIEDDSGSYGDSIDVFDQINVRTGNVGVLFERIADALILITQAEIGIGFFFILAQGVRTTSQRMIRYSAFAVAALIVVLSFAFFGKSMSVWNSYFNALYDDGGYSSTSGFDYFSFNQGLRVVRQLISSINIILWLTSLPMIAFASIVLHKAKAVPTLRSSAVIFLMTTILNFIRYFWGLIYSAAYLIQNRSVPDAISIVDPILDYWVLFVLLVLLFVLSVRKKKGLWTVQNGWMKNAPYGPGMTQQPMHQGTWPQPQQGTYGAPPVYQGQPGQYQQYPPQQQFVQQPHPQQNGASPPPQQMWHTPGPQQQQHGLHSTGGGSPPYVPGSSPQELGHGDHNIKQTSAVQ